MNNNPIDVSQSSNKNAEDELLLKLDHNVDMWDRLI